MAASKRNRRAQAPLKILFCAALFVASFVVYGIGISVYEHRHRPSKTDHNHAWESAGEPQTQAAPQRAPLSTPDSSTPPESADQWQQTYQVGEYSRLYGERQRSLLAGDATNLDFEAVEHAGDSDGGFLEMNERKSTSRICTASGGNER